MNFSKLPPEKKFFDLSLWPAPLAFLFVKVFHRTGLRPEWFVLLSFCFGVLLALAIVNEASKGWILLFLFFRAFFDVVDGMWARATKTVTPLGGLLDLSGDILSNTLLFAALGLNLSKTIGPMAALGLTCAAWLICHFTMTTYSFNFFLYQTEGKIPPSRFVEGDFQSVRILPLIFLYRMTWRVLALGVLRLRGPLGFLSLFGLCSHLLYLTVCVLFWVPEGFVFVELALGLIFVLFLAGRTLKKSRPRIEGSGPSSNL
ncbi:MAG: CDP-alcohol phosphatidyltransferase family protein [Deltaproteobacteria bacterium]|nr:CDP-alcohol phosphatidyltransferase family protein [Deltaproteobacteria bacterium]